MKAHLDATSLEKNNNVLQHNNMANPPKNTMRTNFMPLFDLKQEGSR
jgi:hypothetical protein